MITHSNTTNYLDTRFFPAHHVVIKIIIFHQVVTIPLYMKYMIPTSSMLVLPLLATAPLITVVVNIHSFTRESGSINLVVYCDFRS